MQRAKAGRRGICLMHFAAALSLLFISHHFTNTYLFGAFLPQSQYLQPHSFTMQLLISLVSLLAASSFAVAGPTSQQSAETQYKNAAFFLAGDSTVADNAGWGDGFLSTVTNGSFGMNYGHSGTTTVSFRELGDWARVLAQTAKAKRLGYEPVVTIQVRAG